MTDDNTEFQLVVYDQDTGEEIPLTGKSFNKSIDIDFIYDKAESFTMEVNKITNPSANPYYILFEDFLKDYHGTDHKVDADKINNYISNMVFKITIGE